MSLAYVPLHSLRRAFVAATCALVGSFVSPASFAWDLTILHVNDVHSPALTTAAPSTTTPMPSAASPELRRS